MWHVHANIWNEESMSHNIFSFHFQTRGSSLLDPFLYYSKTAGRHLSVLVPSNLTTAKLTESGNQHLGNSSQSVIWTGATRSVRAATFHLLHACLANSTLCSDFFVFSSTIDHCFLKLQILLQWTPRVPRKARTTRITSNPSADISCWVGPTVRPVPWGRAGSATTGGPWH